MEKKEIQITKIKNNTGQIEGLPQNPRLIKDDRFKKLVKSIEDHPEMLELRELIVYPLDKNYIVIGGNMRLRAMQELKYKKASCKVLDKDISPEKLRAYAIKDNVGYGDDDWDLLSNEWDLEELKDWGLEVLDLNAEETELSEKNKLDELAEHATIDIICKSIEKEEIKNFLENKFSETSFEVKVRG